MMIDFQVLGLGVLQPFGGRMLETGGFQGFTIPTRAALGNLHGTTDHAPFFFAEVTAAEY